MVEHDLVDDEIHAAESGERVAHIPRQVVEDRLLRRAGVGDCYVFARNDVFRRLAHDYHAIVEEGVHSGRVSTYRRDLHKRCERSSRDVAEIPPCRMRSRSQHFDLFKRPNLRARGLVCRSIQPESMCHGMAELQGTVRKADFAIGVDSHLKKHGRHDSRQRVDVLLDLPMAHGLREEFLAESAGLLVDS